jgi:hypothetical protein
LGLVALCATGCPEEEPPLTHGFVKIQLARSDSEPDTPFVGTVGILMTMTYDSCFSNFYDANPNWTQEGIDGALVFGTLEDGDEGWKDRLCDPLDPGQAGCEIVEIDQELDVAKQLTVRYTVSDNPENRFLKFGPLPLDERIPEFQCDGGSPRVQINPRSIRGENQQGTVIWEGEALDSDMAAPNQGAAITVKVARND